MLKQNGQLLIEITAITDHVRCTACSLAAREPQVMATTMETKFVLYQTNERLN